jgi:hypothetical protein
MVGVYFGAVVATDRAAIDEQILVAMGADVAQRDAFGMLGHRQCELSLCLGEAVLRPQMERVRRVTKKNEPADSYPVPKSVRPGHDISPISTLRAAIAGAREVWSHLLSKTVTSDTFWPNPSLYLTRFVCGST